MTESGELDSTLAAKLQAWAEEHEEELNVARKAEEEEELRRFRAKLEILGRDWFGLRVRGFRVGVTADSLRTRWAAADTRLMDQTAEQRISGFESFYKGMGVFADFASRVPREHQEYYNKLWRTGGRSIKIISAVTGGKAPPITFLYLVNSIVDLADNPNISSSLQDHLLKQEGLTSLVNKPVHMSILLPILSDWYEVRKQQTNQ